MPLAPLRGFRRGRSPGHDQQPERRRGGRTAASSPRWPGRRRPSRVTGQSPAGDLAPRRCAAVVADPGVREVGAGRQPAAHRGPLAGAQGVHLDLEPAVAGMAAGHEVGAVEELAVGDHDGGRRPGEQLTPVDLDVELIRAAG